MYISIRVTFFDSGGGAEVGVQNMRGCFFLLRLDLLCRFEWMC